MISLSLSCHVSHCLGVSPADHSGSSEGHHTIAHTLRPPPAFSKISAVTNNLSYRRAAAGALRSNHKRGIPALWYSTGSHILRHLAASTSNTSLTLPLASNSPRSPKPIGPIRLDFKHTPHYRRPASQGSSGHRAATGTTHHHSCVTVIALGGGRRPRPRTSLTRARENGQLASVGPSASGIPHRQRTSYTQRQCGC